MTVAMWPHAGSPGGCPWPLASVAALPLSAAALPLSVAALPLVPVFGFPHRRVLQVDNITAAAQLPAADVNITGPSSYGNLERDNTTTVWDTQDPLNHAAAASSVWEEFRFDQALFIYVIAGLCFVVMVVLGLKYVICDKNLKLLRRRRRDVQICRTVYRQPGEFGSTGRLMAAKLR